MIGPCALQYGQKMLDLACSIPQYSLSRLAPLRTVLWATRTHDSVVRNDLPIQPGPEVAVLGLQMEAHVNFLESTWQLGEGDVKAAVSCSACIDFLRSPMIRDRPSMGQLLFFDRSLLCS